MSCSLRILRLLALFPAVLLAQNTDAEKAFAEMKVYDAAGSPLRAPRQDWDGASKRAVEDPAWRSWVDSRRALVDDWMTRRQDRVDWIAGWYHDFVSPKDGSHLTWTADPPGENTLSSPSDPRVTLTPKLFNAWVFQFRGRHASMMADAARLFRLTGEEKYAAWAAGQLDFYAENWDRWPLQTSHNPSRLMHQSLDDATLLRQHLDAARLLEGWVSPERRATWYAKSFKPSALLLNQSAQRVHNISSWQRSSTAQAALYGGDEDLWNSAIDGEFGVRRQIRDGVTGDFLWFEQSFGYNAYVVEAYAPLFEAAAAAGRMDSLRQEMAVIENLMLAPVILRFSTGQLPNPADSTGGLRRAPDTALLARMYRLYPTYAGLEAAAGMRSWETLLDPPAPAERRPLPPVRSISLESSRMALLREGPWQVFFHYGQLDASHAQSEALNFELFYDNVDLSHDPGTVGYGSPLHREYYTRGLAHNVPLIDGEGQERWARGELQKFAPGSVSARQPAYRQWVAAERQLTISENALVDKVTITAGDGQKHRLALALHFQGELVPASAYSAAPERFAVGYPPAFKYWQDLRSGDSAQFQVKVGASTFHVAIESNLPLRITMGTLPDVPPRRHPAIYAEVEGTEATFVTRISNSTR